MIKDIKDVKIGPVWNGGRGASFKEEIEARPDLGGEIRLTSPLTAELLMFRMKNGLSVVLNNISSTVEQTCSRCLDQFTQQLEIEEAEAHFYEKSPQKDLDPLEVYFIQMQNMSIDLTDALRQEIILHFPMIPVCSERCPGLCPSCKVNLKHQEHKKGCDKAKIEQEDGEGEDTYKPFANLKNLL
jgi:uncharacterized protein